MAASFMMPGKIISGRGALKAAGELLPAVGKKALIVTDPTMEKLGNLEKVTDILDQKKIAYAVFSGIYGEPDDGMIKEGLLCYQKENCDFLIGLGGGSPVDAMKAIAMLAVCGGNPIDYMGMNIDQPLLFMAAVPTTAGTGSEATQFTIITDRATQVKMLLKGPSLIPDLAVIDPQFTMTVPPKITAATGIDALTHAIEAYTSKKAQPLSDTFALSACRRIFDNLRTAWEQEIMRMHGSRCHCLHWKQGLHCFPFLSDFLVHGMSRPIGALFHVPHGISNAMLLNICLQYAAEGARERFGAIAVACGFAGAEETRDTACEKLLSQVEMLLHDIEIPTLEEYGIDRDCFMESVPKMASDAMASGSPSNTKEFGCRCPGGLYRALAIRKTMQYITFDESKPLI